MRFSRTTPVGVLAILFIASPLASYLLAQTGSNRITSRPGQERLVQTPTRPTSNLAVKDEIPKGALLTERGSDLANRLRFLRNSETRMGKKHPNYETVQNEIKKIKRELLAWAPAKNLTFATGDESIASMLPLMNDHDVRQVIIHLVGKIESLEARVSKLEQ